MSRADNRPPATVPRSTKARLKSPRRCPLREVVYTKYRLHANAPFSRDPKSGPRLPSAQRRLLGSHRCGLAQEVTRFTSSPSLLLALRPADTDDCDAPPGLPIFANLAGAGNRKPTGHNPSGAADEETLRSHLPRAFSWGIAQADKVSEWTRRRRTAARWRREEY